MLDIYFDPKYGKLNESIENGESIVYKHKSSLGLIHHMFIKREIPIKINNEVYYDIVTSYGYGGPIILESENKKLLIEEFEMEFGKYCDEHNIISEFIRFHPIYKNNIDFQGIYDTTYLREKVVTNLKDEEPINKEFSKCTSKTLRRILREGIEYDVIDNPKDLSIFTNIYYSTMDRNKADNYYYFEEEYFENCLKHFKENILLVNILLDNKIIASSLNFKSNDLLHVHLSGSLSEYLSYSPAYITKYATVKWAKENNYKYIHYGGGTSNSIEDSLYKFKKKFGKNTNFQYYNGKKIWNDKVYKQLCEERNVRIDTEFFPAYRFEGI